MWANRNTSILPMVLIVLAGCSAARRPLDTPSTPPQRYPGAPLLPRETSPKSLATSAEDIAALERAVALITESRYDQAAAILADLGPKLDAASDRTRAGEAMFWQGYCHEKRDAIPVAVELYRRTLRNYADTPAAQSARGRLANLEQRS